MPMKKPKALKPMETVALKCGAKLQLLYTEKGSFTRIRVVGLPLTTYKDESVGMLAETVVLQEVVDFLNRVIATRTTERIPGYQWHKNNCKFE